MFRNRASSAGASCFCPKGSRTHLLQLRRRVPDGPDSTSFLDAFEEALRILMI